MSCFVLRSTTIMELANTICSITNNDVYDLELPDDLRDALRRAGCIKRGELKPIAIADALYTLNVQAYQGRYKDDNAVDPVDFQQVQKSINHKSLTDNHNFNAPWDANGNRIYQDWVYRLVAMLDCYTYQTAEDATDAAPLRLALVNFSKSIKCNIVSRDPRICEWYGM